MIVSAVSILSNLSYLIIKEDDYITVKRWKTDYKRDIVIALGNLAIVGGVMYLINL